MLYGSETKGSAAISRSETKAIVVAAATYVGTVVGAGFASGQEVLQFFGLLGARGLAATAVAALGFWIFGSIVMEAGRATKAASHLPLLRHTAGPLAPLLDVVITFFLFGALAAMVAGAGSVLEQEFGFPWAVGAGMLAIATIVTVMYGFKGVMAAVSSVVPFLLAGVLAISLAVLHRRQPGLGIPTPPSAPPVKHWPAAGITYVSYNLVMSVPVLAALGGTFRTREESKRSAAIGAIGLGLCLILVYLAIVTSFPDVAHYEVPLAHLASSVHKIGGPLYSAVFLAEVYTTAVGNLYGFAARLAHPGSGRFRFIAVITGALSMWAASAGFTNLVRIVYPAVGWAGMLFLAALLSHAIKTRIIFLRKKRGR